MTRPLRIAAPGLNYHITARGTNRMPIYLDDRDRRAFLDRLGQVVGDCHVDCHAYCLMTNHYHLVLRTQEPNVSRVIQRLNSPYAQRWNRWHERVGHVFQGRFGAQVIEDDAYLLVACRYVVLNPVRAGLVRGPADWPWSSYRATAGMTAVPTLLSPETIWQLLSTGPRTAAMANYRRFISEEEDEGRSELPAGLVVGSDAFVERFREPRERASRQSPRAEREVKPSLIDLFEGAVTREGRNASAWNAYRRGYRIAEIARFLNLHPSTVSKMLERERSDRGSDRESVLFSRPDTDGARS